MRLSKAHIVLCLVGGGWLVCKLCRYYKPWGAIRIC